MTDYVDFIGTYQELESKPDIYMIMPPPLYVDGTYGMNQTIMNERFAEIYPMIAQNAGLGSKGVIDCLNPMGGKDLTKYHLFCDD